MTTYALILNNQIIQSVGNLPTAAKRLDTGQWVLPHAGQWTDAQAAACGYLPVVPADRPADTATHTSDRSVELVAGVPTVVWTSRPWTAEEAAARTADTNRTAIEQAVANALAQNRTIVSGADTYLAIASPTNAQIAAQVRSLTTAAKWAARQRNGIIRLVINQYADGTD